MSLKQNIVGTVAAAACVGIGGWFLTPMGEKLRDLFFNGNSETIYTASANVPNRDQTTLECVEASNEILTSLAFDTKLVRAERVKGFSSSVEVTVFCIAILSDDRDWPVDIVLFTASHDARTSLNMVRSLSERMDADFPRVIATYSDNSVMFQGD